MVDLHIVIELFDQYLLAHSRRYSGEPNEQPVPVLQQTTIKGQY